MTLDTLNKKVYYKDYYSVRYSGGKPIEKR